MGTGMLMGADFDGKEIKDVETANRGPYTQFCGYFRRTESVI